MAGGCSRVVFPSFYQFSRWRHFSLPTHLLHSHTAAVFSPKNNRAYSFTPESSNSSFNSITYQTLSTQQKEQISLYVDSLLQWNQKMNLTAVTEESEVMTRHVQDSLAILPPLERAYLAHCSSSSSCRELNIVDVGSGAGLPGVILAIACPSWKFTLLESMRKRCTFLEHVAGLTGLSNVSIICDRAEDRMLGKSLI